MPDITCKRLQALARFLQAPTMPRYSHCGWAWGPLRSGACVLQVRLWRSVPCGLLFCAGLPLIGLLQSDVDPALSGLLARNAPL